MATPQRNIPPGEPPRGPQLTNLSRGGVEKKIGPGWRFGFWWVWLIVVVGIWYVGFGCGNSGGWVWGRNSPRVRNDAGMTGDGAVILNSNNKRRYIGQAFQIDNAPIQRAASSTALWVGTSTDSVPMLLVTSGIRSNPGNTGLERGQSIYASGRVMAAPNAAQAKQQWGLSDADVSKLEQQGAYVQCNQIQRVPR